MEQRFTRLSREAWVKLHHVSTATLTSQLLKLGFRHTFLTGLIPLRPDPRLVGYAFTLRYVPAREDLDMQVEYDNETNIQRIAVEAIGPEEVLVIDARGEVRAASFGHIIATRIMKRGAVGLVTDGALRDSPSFKALDFPVYAKAAHAATSSVLHHPADLNVPIGCAGVQVRPGDVLVGDAEGVVVIPSHVAESVAHRALQQEQMEEFILQKIQQGASIKGIYPPDAATTADYRALTRKLSESGEPGSG
jgi:regulator of RNase E activity RraA